MNTKNYICSCLGLYGSCEYLDDIQENFNVELEEYDIDEALQISPKDLSNAIASILFDKIKHKAVEELNLNEELFDTIINGSLDTHLYYNNQYIYNWEDLEEIANEKYNNIYKNELAMMKIANSLHYKNLYAKSKKAVIADLFTVLTHYSERFLEKEYEEIYNTISNEI